VQCLDTRAMKSLPLPRIIFDTLLWPVNLILFYWMQNRLSTTFKCSAMANHWHVRSRYVTEANCPPCWSSPLYRQSYINKHRLTNDVKDRSRSGRPRIISRREDNALGRLVRRNPFANSTVLKRQWLPHRLLFAKTVRNRLKYVGYRSRRPVKRCLLTQAHKTFRLQ
jgi:hypothetical protein